MTLTIDITPDIEKRVRELAARLGVSLDQYVATALRDHIAAQASRGACLNDVETQLLQQINEGMSELEWCRYYELVEKRRAENLTTDEHAELIATSDRIEEANARRIACLAKLAAFRKVSLHVLMDDLGISPPAVI